MKITLLTPARIYCIVPVLFLLFSDAAHAGLTLQFDFLGEGNGLFTCDPQLSTNANAPDSTPVTYDQLYSTHSNIVAGLGNGHTENRPPFTFSALTQEITNGQWTLVQNVGATNQHTYHFTIGVTNFTSNGFSYPVITYPLNGDTNVPQTPTIQWTGPTNWSALSVFLFNDAFSLTRLAAPSPNTTNYPVSPYLPPGHYSVQIDYTLLTTPSTFTASTPKDATNNSLAGWVFQPAKYDDGTQNGFTVVAPPSLCLYQCRSRARRLLHF